MQKYHLFFLYLFITFSYSQGNKEVKLLDSIHKLREISKDSKLSYNESIEYAKRAVNLSYKLKDSTLLKSKKNLSYLYLINYKIDELEVINFENLELAKKIKDSSAIANANHILGYVYSVKLKYDSAYYHYLEAVKIYKAVKDNKNSGEVLLNMADIQKDERDYIGSEINAVEAKKLIEKLPKNDINLGTLWSINNTIGIVSGKLKLYDKALEYHDLAYSYTNKMTDGYSYKILTNSNIASTYRKKGDYSIAIKKYEEILENEALLAYDSSSYASTISNIAHTKFLSGILNEKEIEKPYREAISIANAINDNSTEIYTHYYLGKYYKKIGDNDSALRYVDKAYKKAKTTKTNEILLESLILKASLTKDSSRQFLMEHIKLNDSLVFAERSIRNKFARIENETDRILEERDKYSRENEWLIITSIGLLVTLFFLYIIKSQREKNKELQLAQQQQEANEEIYNLMLSQQDKMDEARTSEKQRISQELHDGILGRLFGARLSLDSLNLVKTEEAVENRGNYINELKVIEQDIRKVSHDLNTDFIAHSGFLDIIETLVETQTLAYNLKSNVEAEQEINWDAISNRTKIHFYRIVQESLQNIYKHANATRVDILFKQQNNLISLAIKDDGSGFDENKTKKGIGLKNMKSRVKEIKGVLNIQTKANQGTTIEIRVPN